MMNALVVVILCSMYSRTLAVNMTAVQPYDTTATLMFLQEDTDANGVLTLGEIDAVFAKYDQNGDGTTSRIEYTTMLCDANPALYQLSHYLFDDYDVNSDHHLKLQDYEAFHLKMDVDGDQLVSQQEFVTYWIDLFQSIETKQPEHVHGNSHEHGHCPAAAGK